MDYFADFVLLVFPQVIVNKYCLPTAVWTCHLLQGVHSHPSLDAITNIYIIVENAYHTQPYTTRNVLFC